MNGKKLTGTVALMLLWLPLSPAATADSADSSRPVAATPNGDSAKLSIPRGTDLRPCKPGAHSEFSRQTGGYHCVRNP